MKANGCKGIICKVDLEKAYYRVNWDFLDYVLRKKGFVAKWKMWISGCISFVHYAILINGTSRGFFEANRGLQQGDPLLPFLFTLVADILSCLIRRVDDRNLTKGFKMDSNNVAVSHLQFVDDTILFCEARDDYIESLRNILRCFERISGLKVNLGKCEVVGLNISE